MTSVWGRMSYFIDMGRYQGAAIFLDAQNLEPLKWKKSLSPDDQAELRRLERDGHSVSLGKRGAVVEISPSSVRETVLFRTIPHEIGHYVEYLEKVERRTDADLDRLWQLFFARPVREREDFAHRYAEKWREKMRRWVTSRTPEERRALVARDGLNPAWFGL